MLRKPNYVYGEDTLLKVPMPLNFAKYVLRQIWSYKHGIALINGKTHEKLTFRDLAKSAMNLAISLNRMGVGKGDVIAICSENRQEFFSTLIGIICTGATVTCVNPAYTKGELKHVLGISKPKIIFYSPVAYKTHVKTLETLPYLQKLVLFGQERQNNTLLYEELAKPVHQIKGFATEDGNSVNQDEIVLENFAVVDVMGQTDTAVILYSSGTTGLPKGVMLTHMNLIASCEAPDTVDPKEMSLHITPWYHVMGMIGVARIFYSGGTVVYLSKFDADFFMKTIEAYKVVQMVVAPPVLIAVCKSQANYDVSTVKIMYCGAAPLRDDTIAAVKQRFPKLIAVLQGYGMTECTLAATRDTYLEAQETKIVDVETRKILGPNQPGEICLKGPSIMKGYVGKDRRDDFDDEEFFRTGDIGYYDDDKYFFIVDRLKELIKYKGYQVAPAEIEAVLLQHPGIRDAGVVGVPHETGGEVPRAFVVHQSGSNLSEEEIKAFVAEKLSNPKHIRGGVRFVSEIPKTPSGKIMRKLLREMVKAKSKL
ncbi:luciferin 4-monooxygenase-like isoform X2 [Maniola hyperantus]|uniref:luciferin 4-monooxygenase-like isoform X2 n=1 Tax=Aphantopus hyperantus TaxID=2795564 RepID=UPI003748FA20